MVKQTHDSQTLFSFFNYVYFTAHVRPLWSHPSQKLRNHNFSLGYFISIPLSRCENAWSFREINLSVGHWMKLFCWLEEAESEDTWRLMWVEILGNVAFQGEVWCLVRHSFEALCRGQSIKIIVVHLNVHNNSKYILSNEEHYAAANPATIAHTCSPIL